MIIKEESEILQFSDALSYIESDLKSASINQEIV